MALPQGVDFRATSGYVTDPTNCTYETLTGSPYVNYPTTTPQGSNIGWETSSFAWLNSRDRSTGVDARLAGILYNSNANTPVYRIDLPATGSHNIGLAMGDMGSSQAATVVFKDDITTISTVSGTFAAANFLDATGVSRTAAAWPGSQALLAHTFASTIFRAELGTGSANSGFIAHLYIESAGGATTHATTGALAASGATLAGTAAHIAKHATSGALAGSGAAVAGSSARTRAHPTSGALAGGGATLAGAADHAVPGGTHDTSGTLTGAGAAVVGSAAHIAKHATSGALEGSGATLAGSAARVAAAVTHATSGALVGDGAVVTGLATGPNVSFGGGSWFPNVSKRTRKDDDELTQEVVEAVAAAPKARQKLTLANLIGKTAAAQVSREELDKAVAVVKRKKRRQDDELMLLM
jgi:hypothetical protein